MGLRFSSQALGWPQVVEVVHQHRLIGGLDRVRFTFPHLDSQVKKYRNIIIALVTGKLTYRSFYHI